MRNHCLAMSSSGLRWPTRPQSFHERLIHALDMRPEPEDKLCWPRRCETSLSRPDSLFKGPCNDLSRIAHATCHSATSQNKSNNASTVRKEKSLRSRWQQPRRRHLAVSTCRDTLPFHPRSRETVTTTIRDRKRIANSLSRTVLQQTAFVNMSSKIQ